MRWSGVVVGLLAVGCTATNPDFRHGSAETASGSGSAGQTTDTPAPTTTDPSGPAPTTGGSGSDSAVPTTDDSTTTSGPDDTGLISETGIGDSSSGIAPTGPVLLLFASDASWAGNDHTEPYPEAVALCNDSVPDECESPAVAVLRFGVDPLTDAFSTWDVNLPIYAAEWPEPIELASTPQKLLDGGPVVPLAQVGIGEGAFWSGGTADMPSNCGNWDTDGDEVGTLGSFHETTYWLDAEDDFCTSVLPILCACRSYDDHFE